MKLFKSLFGKPSSGATPKEESPATSVENTSPQAERDADVLKFDALRASKIGEYPFAIKAFGKALELRPEFETRYYLAETLMRIGATRQALKHLDLLVEEEPNHLTTRIYRAKAEYEEGQYDKAIEDLKTALALTEEEKDLALLHRLLAANYLAQKEWQNAVDEATKAIDLHDEEPTSSLYKTKALVALEQWDEATEFLREAFRAFPEEERFLLYEADIALAKGDYPAAQTAYRTALDKDPFNEDACCGLGHIEELSGNLSQAIQLLQGYVEDGIVGKNILTYLIQLLDKSGRGEETTPYKAQLQEMDESEAQSKADFEYIHDTSVYGDIFGHLEGGWQKSFTWYGSGGSLAFTPLGGSVKSKLRASPEQSTSLSPRSWRLSAPIPAPRYPLLWVREQRTVGRGLIIRYSRALLWMVPRPEIRECVSTEG